MHAVGVGTTTVIPAGLIRAFGRPNFATNGIPTGKFGCAFVWPSPTPCRMQPGLPVWVSLVSSLGLRRYIPVCAIMYNYLCMSDSDEV
jgi:hypothetical protein